MKYIKTFEVTIDSTNLKLHTNLLKKYTFKIGEYVIIDDDISDIAKIVAIDTNAPFQPYKIWDDAGYYWFSGNKFRRPTKEELDNFLIKNDTDKYNL